METSNQKTGGETSPEQADGILIRVLTGWGIPGSVARILAGAILGALSALWALSQMACVAEWNRWPDGASSWHGKVDFTLMPYEESLAK